ncbi:glycosyltransferase [Microbacterium sp. NPDC057650]|uniref:glycosyltransferase n=1 Tax=unclassified Microbacterium TaxID=2609290 RepID=UPI00366B4E6C
MARPKTLVLSPTPLARSPRARKQVVALRDSHDLVTASRGETPFPGIEHVRLPDVDQRWGLLGRLLYLTALALHLYPLITRLSAQDELIRRRLGDRRWDLIIAHDVQTSAVAEQLTSRRLMVDLHEYAPRQNEHSRAWRMLIAPYFRWIIRGPVRRASATTTVSQGIVDEYRKEFGLDPTLIINATPYQELTPTPVHSPLRLVHSGVAAPHRHLEILIDAVLQSPADITLDLYLVDSDGAYGSSLRVRAAGDPRISLHPAVPYETLIETLSQHDLGVHVLPPISFNHRHALPNKLFDYVQARLGVIVGPSPEMASIVSASGLGVVTAGFTPASLRDAIDALQPEQVAEFKSAAARGARDLSSEKQMATFTELVARVMA